MSGVINNDGSTEVSTVPEAVMVIDGTVEDKDEDVDIANRSSESNKDMIGGNNEDQMEKKKKKAKTRRFCSTRWMCLWGTLGTICIGLIVLLLVRMTNRLEAQESQSNNYNNNDTPLSSTPAEPTCPNKRLRVTHICNVPDLDDTWFFTDTTMDIKVLMNDQVYWPRNITLDCNESYGSYDGSCVIPDSSLLNSCYPLKNHVNLEFGDQTPPKDLKVTIYDEDIGEDEYIDIFVSKDKWYYPSRCEDGLQLQFYHSSSDAYIKLEIDTIEEGEEIICGADLDAVLVGLDETAVAFDDMETALVQYVTLSNGDEDGDGGGGRRRHRKLLFPALFAGAKFLVSGVTSLVGSFTRGAKSQGILSTLADFTTIGSTWFSSGDPNHPGQDKSEEYFKKTEQYFKQVFKRFDNIDKQLQSIQEQISNGFQTLELVVQEAFAQQELDDWINGHLSTLRTDFVSYKNPNHTPSTRRVYEDVFRNSCQQTNSPYTIFRILYSHACTTCDKFELNGSKSQQYMLDTFVDLANSNFSSNEIDRVLWFRQSFGILIVGSLIECMYLHSVCLYQPNTICQNEDPIFYKRLNDMGDALEEIATSLTNAETRLE